MTGSALGYILKSVVDSKSKGNVNIYQRGFAIAEFRNFKIEGVFTKMELKEGYYVDVEAKPKTAAGHDAGIEEGSGRFSSADESVVSVGPNPNDPTNEKKARFTSLDGSSNESVGVEFRADGIKGEGVREIVIAGVIIATQGDAATGEMSFGTPTPVETAPEAQPDTTPAETPAEPAPVDPGTEVPATGDVPAETPATDEAPADPGAAPDNGPVEPGDPGTATGEPIPTEVPGEPAIPTPEGVEAGQPGGPPTEGVDPANLDPVDRVNAGKSDTGNG